MLLALALCLYAPGGEFTIPVSGSRDETVVRAGLTVELKWEKHETQRLTLRGSADRDVVVSFQRRLAPSRVLFKAKPVKRDIGEWTTSAEPRWRTVGDVLHVDLFVPKGFLAGAPSFTLMGRSSDDDVKRADGLIQFVKRIRPWLMPGSGLSEERTRTLGELAMRHAVKVDGEEDAEAVGTALRTDLLAFIGPQPSALAASVAGISVECEMDAKGRVTPHAKAAWPFGNPTIGTVSYGRGDLLVLDGRAHMAEPGQQAGLTLIRGVYTLTLDGMTLCGEFTSELDCSALCAWQVAGRELEWSPSGSVVLPGPGHADLTSRLVANAAQVVRFVLTGADGELSLNDKPLSRVRDKSGQVFRGSLKAGENRLMLRTTGTFTLRLTDLSGKPLRIVRQLAGFGGNGR